MERRRADWPERYYLELDPDKRKALLEEAIQAGEGDPAENGLRRKLWERRYGGGRGGAPVDAYLGLWMDLNYHRGRGVPAWRKKSVAKELGKKLDELGLWTEPGSPEEALTGRELEQMVAFYLASCNEGNYGTQVFGLMRLKRDQLVGKIAEELYEVAYALPERLGMAGDFAPLRRAVRSAFADAYPDDIDSLDRRIAGGRGD